MKAKLCSVQKIGILSGLILAAMIFCLSGAGCSEESAGKLKIGHRAPAITLEKLLQAPDGADASWKALQGKVVVLEFWATWCGPCVAAIPHINKLADKFKNKPIIFISITDEDESVIKSFLKKRAIKTWIGLDLDDSMHKAYGITGIPHTVVVDKQGSVAVVTHPSSLNAKHLSDLLADKKLSLSEGQGKCISPGRLPEEANGKLPLLQVMIRPSVGDSGGSASTRGKWTALGRDAKSLIYKAYESRGTRSIFNCSLPEDKYDVVMNMPKGCEHFSQPIRIGWNRLEKY
ncbi:MAG: TlpA family protein disulfide reductase [Planctomycetota bacterium]|jgi:thiol-disulfide isomerase/thioredoxin